MMYKIFTTKEFDEYYEDLDKSLQIKINKEIGQL